MSLKFSCKTHMLLCRHKKAAWLALKVHDLWHYPNQKYCHNFFVKNQHFTTFIYIQSSTNVCPRSLLKYLLWKNLNYFVKSSTETFSSICFPISLYPIPPTLRLLLRTSQTGRADGYHVFLQTQDRIFFKLLTHALFGSA